MVTSGVMNDGFVFNLFLCSTHLLLLLLVRDQHCAVCTHVMCVSVPR